MSERLWTYFGFSYASWLTIPRVMMHAMPDEWQEKMAALLEEFAAAYPNQPPMGTRVQVTDMNGKLVKTPEWLINYRHPDQMMIDKLRLQNEDCDSW